MKVNFLKKKHYKINGGTKYFIDCSEINSDSNTIFPTEILKNINDISILKAVLNYTKYIKKNKNIVIKIAHESKTNKKEYDISQRLSGINGFIKNICLFKCYDNTYEQILYNKQLPSKICTADNINENNKLVLILPYIQEGSIRNYKWNLENIYILKSLLKQSIISLMEAYIKHGFLHNDLHLDNILFKKTKINNIKYDNNIEIKTNGYKIIIMDFDSSFIDVDRIVGIEYFWSNLGNLISRLVYDLNDKIIPIKYDDEIERFIRYAKINKIDVKNSIKLLELIDKLEFKLAEPLQILKYDPNIY
jgi:hypothetical protein